MDLFHRCFGLMLLWVAASGAAFGCPALPGAEVWQLAVCELGGQPPDFEVALAAASQKAPLSLDRKPSDAVIGMLALQEIGAAGFVEPQGPPEKLLEKLQVLLVAEGLPTLNLAEQADLVVAGTMNQATKAPPFDQMTDWQLMDNWMSAWLSPYARRPLYVDTSFNLFGILIVTETEFCRWAGVAIGPDIALIDLSQGYQQFAVGPRDCEIIS